MSEPKDPEQLLAQALRAQAVRAPHTPPPSAPSEAAGSAGSAGSGSQPAVRPPTPDQQQPDPTTVESPVPQYGLLSGIGAASLEAENAALGPAEPAMEPASPTATGRNEQAGQPTTHRAAASNRLPVHWILLLAVLLGLATGAVIGLITLL